MSINLGNVAGVVIGPNPPLEADGVTEKRYVLWGQPITGGGSNSYILKYWNHTTGQWTDFNPNNIINDSMATEQITGQLTFSKVKILSLISGGVAKVVGYGSFTIYKASGNTAQFLESGDFVCGFVEGVFLKLAKYNGGDPELLASFTIFDSLEP